MRLIRLLIRSLLIYSTLIQSLLIRILLIQTFLIKSLLIQSSQIQPLFIQPTLIQSSLNIPKRPNSSVWSALQMSYVQNSTSGGKHASNFWTPTKHMQRLSRKLQTTRILFKAPTYYNNLSLKLLRLLIWFLGLDFAGL